MKHWTAKKKEALIAGDLSTLKSLSKRRRNTAILATYGSGRPVIAVHVEYDALPSGSQAPGATERQEIVKGAPGHAEGHNTNAALWIGAAFAVKQAIDTHHLTGMIKLFSAPAEEQGISRPYFVRDGYFRDVEYRAGRHAGVDRGGTGISPADPASGRRETDRA